LSVPTLDMKSAYFIVFSGVSVQCPCGEATILPIIAGDMMFPPVKLRVFVLWAAAQRYAAA